MSLIDFANVILGLGLGFITTVTVFMIGDAIIDIVSFGEKPDVVIIGMAILIWLMISYGVIVLVL